MANLSKKIEKHLERKLNFDTDVVLQNDGGETYIKEWNVAEEQPELEDLEKIDVTTELAEYDAQAYARKRATEYPSTGDQLDYIFHNGVAKWKTDVIEPVKAKYPKTNVWPGYGNPADL